MTNEERQLIEGLFNRLSSLGREPKDRDAEAMIAQGLRRLPDAPYYLVQSTLMLEQALKEAQAQIQALEAQAGRGAGMGSGSFLGAGRPGPSSYSSSSSVPPSGPEPSPRPVPSAGFAPPGGSPWGPATSAPQAAGGGFFSRAMSTAAGVAGGIMVGDALRNMFGGGFGLGQPHAPHETAAYEAHESHESGGAGPPTDDDPSNDPGYDQAEDTSTYDAGNDPGFDTGGGGGMDT